MAIFETLSQEDKNAIYDYIYQYGSREGCSQPTATLEHILSYWDSAKSEYLYDIFGHELILTKTIQFEKSESEMADDISNTITSPRRASNEVYRFVTAWSEMIDDIYDAIPDDDDEKRNLFWSLRDLISSRSLASNRYTGRTVEVPLPNDKKYRLSPGAKVSKAIGKIAMAYNLPYYEEFRIAHSQVLNEKSVSGELCMSIHPLDYMTMSDNDCGWNSCMSWSDFGDFRQGTVEMMNSPMVVVVYLKSATDYYINSRDGVKWNSKRWRELFVITPDLIAGIKGYPYWNRNLEDLSIRWIKDVIKDSGIKGFGPYDDHISIFEGHNNHVYDSEANEFYLRFESKLMYNDFYDTHHVMLAKNYTAPDVINYSGVSECLCCGGELYDWETESDLFCGSCDPVYRCVECGDWHPLEDLIEVDGDLLCEYCYNDNVIECSGCGTPHLYDNVEHIHLAKDDNTICLDKEIYLDDDCIYYSEYFSKEKLYYKTGRWGSRVYYVLIDDLTEKGLNLFDFNSPEEAREFKSDYIYEAD